MSNLLAEFEKKEMETFGASKQIPNFRSGDTVKVSVRIIEGANERVQMFEGVVIARRSAGINSSIVVRKISHDEGVERRFFLYSPLVKAIEVVRHGVVRRAKLYYLRNLRGKAARIKEDLRFVVSKKNKK